MQDSCEVKISGIITESGYDSICVEVLRNQQLWKQYYAVLEYDSSAAKFSFRPKIHAELSEYSFLIKVDSHLFAQIDNVVCGDVFLITGQSNSYRGDYHAKYCNEFCRSFGKHTGYNVYYPADTSWGLSSGKGYTKYSFVGALGIHLQQLITETYKIPTCFINGGSGGSNIEYNLPNPEDSLDLHSTYGRLLYRTQKAGLVNDVKAIIWHQGEADSHPCCWQYYADRFDLLRKAWKKDYKTLNKIYTFQIHPGCGGENQSQLREVQRTLSENYPDVKIMSTMGIVGHDGCHYEYTGYYQMAEWIFRLIARDFYDSTDSLLITPPNIKYAYTEDHKQIVLEFDQPIVWPADTLGQSMKDYFYLDDTDVYVDSGYVGISENFIFLNLSEISSATTVTYLPNKYYNGNSVIYEGPWLKNQWGIGALSFYEFPINF